jgi:transposase
MPEHSLIRRLLLPELELTASWYRPLQHTTHLEAEKKSGMEVCPRCATPSTSTYDHRKVRLKDAPLRDKAVVLWVRKRRFSCKPCGKPFTEPVPGVRKGCRSTERYKRSVLWACENFSDLKAVRTAYRCSSGIVYRTLYEQLELKRRQRLYPWPRVIGIDEHFFKRHPLFGTREFVSVLVDFKGRRLMEVVHGRTSAELRAALDYIPGRLNVRFVVLDMSDGYKGFARDFFPNAELVADKFHVLRLLSPHINRRRRLITGDKRTLGVRRLLLRSGFTLHHGQRFLLNRWLQLHPELNEVYRVKEAMHSLYRVRGYNRAAHVFTRLTDELARTQLPELRTLRRTLMKWRIEILAYFATGLTNGRTEGFNNKAKVVKRRAYGYRSFVNYRLRLLNACA